MYWIDPMTRRHITLIAGTAALAGLAVAGLERTLVAVIHQSVQVGVRLHVDVTAGAAVTAVGAAELHVFFTTEAEASCSALSSFDCD